MMSESLASVDVKLPQGMGLDRIQNHDCVSVFQKSGVECQPIVGGGFHGEYDLALYKGQSPYLFQ